MEVPLPRPYMAKGRSAAHSVARKGLANLVSQIFTAGASPCGGQSGVQEQLTSANQGGPWPLPQKSWGG
eukprot:scaffold312_cov256-Pinguiococcus_pyrenoidosus.AAC.4